MSLLDKLKSLLGIDSTGESSTGDERTVGVTVERESGTDPDARTERAVKEPVEGDGTDVEEPEAEVEEPDDTEEAEGSEESAASEEAAPADEVEDAGEPAEAEDIEETAGTTDAEETTSTEDVEETASTEDAEEPQAPSEAVDVIKGIGPTYAGRLSDAGVETVADLATSDVESLAEETGVSEKRIRNWSQRAKHR